MTATLILLAFGCLCVGGLAWAVGTVWGWK